MGVYGKKFYKEQIFMNAGELTYEIVATTCGDLQAYRNTCPSSVFYAIGKSQTSFRNVLKEILDYNEAFLAQKERRNAFSQK